MFVRTARWLCILGLLEEIETYTIRICVSAPRMFNGLLRSVPRWKFGIYITKAY